MKLSGIDEISLKREVVEKYVPKLEAVFQDLGIISDAFLKKLLMKLMIILKIMLYLFLLVLSMLVLMKIIIW